MSSDDESVWFGAAPNIVNTNKANDGAKTLTLQTVVATDVIKLLKN